MNLIWHKRDAGSHCPAFFSVFPALICLLFFSCCSIKPVYKKKNIAYGSHSLSLDLYAPKKIKQPCKVMVFVYGGNWVHGKRSTYRFVGKGFARKGIVCVVPDYRLSPETNVAGMADDIAEAIKWVKDNCASFTCDSGQIYVSGHSAGGHLAAMVATDNSYFKKLNIKNPLKGAVLIDAFGLNMYKYLSESYNIKDTLYLPTFSTDPAKWKVYSPVYYLNEKTLPMMQLVGTKTYPAIKEVNAVFRQELKKIQPGAPFISVKGKNHYRMIFQFLNPCSKAYKDILDFMEVKK